MTEQKNRHALFVQIQQDHHELIRLLGEVHQALSKKVGNGARLVEIVESLTDHVERHFREEEASGVFNEVAAHAPRLASRAEELLAEHNQLRQAVQALNQAARSGDGTADWWERLEATFRDFSKNLMHHEHREDELVQIAYDQDLGAAD